MSHCRIQQSLTEPLILESVWKSLKGHEFQQHPELLDGLARMGESLARNQASRDPWIDWKVHGKDSSDSGKDSIDDFETVQVWVGRARNVHNYHGADAPFIKTRSKIRLSPIELKELLLDSSRIKTYNAWSTGRQDLWVQSEALPTKGKQPNDDRTTATTKVVKNTVQPPVGSALVGVTLLHARPLLNEAWIVVSRAVGGDAYFNDQDLATAGRSDILLGVNLIEPVANDAGACILTAVTHASSSSIPSMLAERFGVKGGGKSFRVYQRVF
jgi:hypothetical protein